MIAPYGTWTSPITARMVAAASLRLGQVTVAGDEVFWIEGRPDEGGRHVIVKRTASGALVDVSPFTANARSRVHEYGGASYVPCGDVVYYSEFADQRLYGVRVGGTPLALTPAGPWMYADPDVDPLRRRLVCVREDHTVAGREATTTLVGVSLDHGPSAGEVLVAGHDFYAAPRFSRDGSRLAWLAWQHPQMPWDGTELWQAEVRTDGTLGSPRVVAGGDDESIVQPGWAADGSLYFISDRSGWWNLYCWCGDAVRPVCPIEADCGRPMWQLGTSTWAFAGPSRIVMAYAQRGRWRLATVDLQTGALRDVPTEVEPADCVAATGTHAVVLGGGPRRPDAIARVELLTGVTETLRSTCELTVAPSLAEPHAIEFDTADAATAYAFYYPPAHPDFVAPVSERPPLIVVCHGGPTAAAHARLSLETQFWTSRGFAVVEGDLVEHPVAVERVVHRARGDQRVLGVAQIDAGEVSRDLAHHVELARRDTCER